jgi:signal transduction histidine kinase
MSVIDSTFSEQGYNTIKNSQVPALISLNDLIKETLRRAQSEVDSVQLIVRCETLPQVKADRDGMLKLFDELLGMILKYPPKSSRLFLYVDCEEDASDLIDMNLEEGFKRYSIKFFTNIITHDTWKLVNSQALIHCRQILSNHNGNLVVNDISSTGCLFSVQLPGKIE